MANSPLLTFSNIKHTVVDSLVNGEITYKDEAISILFNTGEGGNTHYLCSYVSPFNTITGNFVSNKSLARFEVRVNPIESTEYGPGIGDQVFYIINVTAGVTNSFTIPISSTGFTGSASDTYRVCLMAQSEADYSWDVTQVFMSLDNTNKTTPEIFKPTSDDGIEVHLVAN